MNDNQDPVQHAAFAGSQLHHQDMKNLNESQEALQIMGLKLTETEGGEA